MQNDAMVEAVAEAICKADGGNWKVSKAWPRGRLYRAYARAALSACEPLIRERALREAAANVHSVLSSLGARASAVVAEREILSLILEHSNDHA